MRNRRKQPTRASLLLQRALTLASRGYSVVPVRVTWKGTDKELYFPEGGWQEVATTDEERISERWNWKWATHVGINCEASGIAVIDLDVKDGKDGPGEWRRLLAEHPETELGPEVSTSSGGSHIVYRARPELPTISTTSELADGVDTRGMGGFLIAYDNHEGLPPVATLPVIPGWVPETLGTSSGRLHAVGEARVATEDTPYGLAALRGEIAILQAASNGKRNDTLNIAALKLGHLVTGGELIEDTVRTHLTKTAQEIGLDAKDLGTISSGLEAGKQDPRNAPSRGLLEFDRTDTGNAERLARLFGDRLRYVPEWGWMAWDGRRWVRDPSGQEAKICARAMSERLLADVSAQVHPDADERSKWMGWVTKSRSATAVKAMIHLAEADPAFLRKTTDFDRHPDLLTVGNGTVDLRTGQLLPHDPKHQITKITEINHSANAECPQFMEWLAWFAAGDADRMEYLQRLAGLAVIGDNREQISPYFLGEAETGKSTLCDILYKVIGEYAATASPDMLAVKGANTTGHRDELASLAGARMLIIGEIPRGWALNTSLYNEIVGADQDMRVSFKGKSTFSYRPQFTLFIHGNHTPVIKDSSNGVSRRMKIIKCYAVRQGEKDTRLASRLVETEGTGILAWAIQGAVAELAGEKLAHPQDVEGASQEVKETNNDVQHFVEECLTFGERLKLGNSTLWALYEQWRDSGGGQIVQPNEGAARLAVEVLGYAVSRGHKVVRSGKPFKDKYANGKNQRGLTGVGPVAPPAPTPSVGSQNKQ